MSRSSHSTVTKYQLYIISEHIFIPTQFVMEATRGDKRAKLGRAGEGSRAGVKLLANSIYELGGHASKEAECSPSLFPLV